MDGHIYCVAVFQQGEDNPHIHIYMDQSLQMVNTNGFIFDMFAAVVGEPVLKSVWNVTGLLRYLMTEGSLVVFTHNSTLLDRSEDDEPDTGLSGGRSSTISSKTNIRNVVKGLLDHNNNMDLKSVNQYCLTNYFSLYDQSKIQTAYQNWVSKHVFDKQKEDVLNQDPFVTLAVFHWISSQNSHKNVGKCLTSIENHSQPAYYYIYELNYTEEPAIMSFLCMLCSFPMTIPKLFLTISKGGLKL